MTTNNNTATASEMNNFFGKKILKNEALFRKVNTDEFLGISVIVYAEFGEFEIKIEYGKERVMDDGFEKMRSQNRFEDIEKIIKQF